MGMVNYVNANGDFKQVCTDNESEFVDIEDYKSSNE